MQLSRLPRAPFDALGAEAALVAIGLESVVDGTLTWGVGKSEVAAALPGQIRRIMSKFLQSDETPDVAALPAFDLKKAQKILNKKPILDEKHADAIAERITNAGLAMTLAADASRILNWLSSQLPRSASMTAMGPQSDPIPRSEVAKFARVWSVGMDPLIVVRDLAEGALSLDMVQAIEVCYPNLFNMIRGIMENLLASLRVRKGEKYQLPMRKDRMVSLLQGQGSDMSVPLAQDFQAMYAQSTKPAGPSPTAKLNLKTDLETPGQSSPGSKE